MGSAIRTAPTVRLALAVGATMLIEELVLMLVFGVDDAHSGELGAILDAAILTLVFTPSYPLVVWLTARAQFERTTVIINTVAVGIATFSVQCGSHLFSHFIGRAWGPAETSLLDATVMSILLGVFAAWLDIMERQRARAGLLGPSQRRAETIAIIASAAFVALIATMTPAFVAIADDLAGEPPGDLQQLIDLAGRQTMHAEALGRAIAAKHPASEVLEIMRASDANQQELADLTEAYIARTQPGATIRQQLPGNLTLLAARDRMMASASAWAASPDAGRERMGGRLQGDIDQFVPLMNRAALQVRDFERARATNLAHSAYSLLVRVCGGMLILVTLIPVIRLMRARQRQLQNALEEAVQSRSQLESVQAALDLHAIVAITDAKGRITHANDRFCAISGYAREELLGQNHRILNSGSHPKEFFVDMWRRIGRGENFRATICNRTKDGAPYWVDTTIAPVMGPDGRPQAYVSIRYDITPLKLAEAELIELNAALEGRVNARTAALAEAKLAAELANAAKSRFLATMSHELRTPLTSIFSYAELIEETAAEAGRNLERGDARAIVLASRHLLELISEILDFSKLEAGKLLVKHETLEIGPLLEEVASAVRPLLERQSNTFQVSAADDLPALSSDGSRLRQCLLNLLSNAAKFTEHGRVELSVRRDDRPGAPGVRFEIRDTGIGIAPLALAELFEPFRQADDSIERRYGGTGLGLAITRQLAERLGGSISARSVEGEGSTFSLWIPNEAAQASPLAQEKVA